MCHHAGINIRMVTGDNLDTAKAIAIDAGIVSAQDADNKYVCMEGKQFRELCGGLKKLEDPNDENLVKESISDMHNFKQIAAKLKVLARSTPEDKYMLVTGLKELNAVVAVTGDGTNDAPALKKADVGFAMGITGTEVAKEASDIILLDDNFASIITAIRWGRSIYTNVRKFLQFQLTVNCVAMFIVFLGGVVVSEPPLTAVQMLWVNLIMDTFGALALATEPPASDILDQPPYKRTERIVTPIMWRNIIGQFIFQATVLCIFLFAGKSMFGYTYLESEPFFKLDPVTDEMYATEKTEHYTIIFNTFVFMQVFNEINARKIGAREFNIFAGFFNNFLFLGIILATILVQVGLVQYGGQPVRTAPLTPKQHGLCIVIGLFSLIQGKLNIFSINTLIAFRRHCEASPASVLVHLVQLQRERHDRRGREGLLRGHFQEELQRLCYQGWWRPGQGRPVLHCHQQLSRNATKDAHLASYSNHLEQS
jgi:Ca2+ transporting ATPase